jgi:hypothetical protein
VQLNWVGQAPNGRVVELGKIDNDETSERFCISAQVVPGNSAVPTKTPAGFKNIISLGPKVVPGATLIPGTTLG